MQCHRADLTLLTAGLRTVDVPLRKQVILALGDSGDPKAVEMNDTLVETLLDQVRHTGAGGSSTEVTPNSASNLVELAAAHSGAALGGGS